MLESLNFKHKDEATKKCCSLGSVEQAVILQTCHRVEIYVTINNMDSQEMTDSIVKRIQLLWSQEVRVSSDVIDRIVEVFRGREALLHLLQLASGLESVVIGEDQILGQVRTAYVELEEIGAANTQLGRAFMKAVNVGRRVRNQTRINRGKVSLGSVAIDLAEKEFRNLNQVRALVVGAGEAGTLVAQELVRRGARVSIANRTFDTGRDLAGKIGGNAIPFEQVQDELTICDLAVFAVSVNEALLRFEDATNILRSRKGEKLVLIDMSQPRCVEAAVGSQPGVELRNLDDLKSVAEENSRERLAQAEEAKRIILEELESLENALGKMSVEPLVSALCAKADKIREKELRKALRMVGSISEKESTVITNLTKELTERILQLPVESLRRAALNRDVELLSAARRLFELE
jgi:glutamyl-tRNA reductase